MGYSSSLPGSFTPSSLSTKSEAFHKAYQYMSTGRKLKSRRYYKCRLIVKLLLVTFLILLVQDEVLKLVIHLRETDIRTSFDYPAVVGNFSSVVNRFRLGTLDPEDTQPINLNYSKIGFLRNAIHPEELDKPYGLLIVVKSATRYYKKRDAIRKSWGSPMYLQYTSISSNLSTKLVFLCGIPKDSTPGEELFPDEQEFNDIILADFDDNYANNTFKSVLALKWATSESPSDYQYLLLVDDDMYINLKNMIPFVRTLKDRRVYKNVDTDSSIPMLNLSPKNGDLNSPSVPALDNGLYMGMVYWNACPVRMRSSVLHFFDSGKKWDVSLDQYPYNMYPTYIPGAAIFLAKKTVEDLYFGSHYVKHFWIDDVYLGIVAYKMGILPLHIPLFMSEINSLRDVNKTVFLDAMTLHGFSCPRQMFDLFHSGDLAKAQAYHC